MLNALVKKLQRVYKNGQINFRNAQNEHFLF